MNNQEKFWKGEFGDVYIKRNQKKLIKNNLVFFNKILKEKKNNIKSVIEFGANIGNNLHALKKLCKKLNKITAIEINNNACKILKRGFKNINIINETMLKYNSKDKYNLTIVKGVLIHINPKDLNKIYEKIYKSSNKYILIAEYYNPTPVKINYRGFKNKLFKRDFAGEFLKKFKNTKLLDYGFVYNKDLYPQDDITWFLISKN